MPESFFTENLLAIEIRKTQMLLNKHAYTYIDLSTINLSKTV